MRILDVNPRVVFPPRVGGAVRTCQLLSHLSRGHVVRQFSQTRVRDFWGRRLEREVWVTPSYLEYRYVSAVPSIVSEWCQRSWLHLPVVNGSTLRFARPARLQHWLQWADVTLVEGPWQFGYCRRHKPRGPLVLASHNLEVTCRRSVAEAAGVSTKNNFWLRYSESLEREAVEHAALILAVSPNDRRGFIEHYGADPGRVIVVPNGADTETYVPVEASEKGRLKKELGLPSRPTVIYLASNAKAPHREGLRWVRAVASRMPDFTFLVVGGLFLRPRIEGNLVASGVVDDPCPYLQAADFSLCPIEHGGGTKIKVLESLAVGLPTVVFSETTLGTELGHLQQVWVSAKTAEELAAGLRGLASNQALAERLRAQGRKHVQEHHDWRKIAAKLEGVLTELVQSAAAFAGASR